MPQVIDGLLAVFRGLAACQPPVAVYDGVGTDMPDTVVVVGGRAIPTAQGLEEHASFPAAAGERWENYDVECVVSAYVAGSDAAAVTAAAGNGQRAARDAAFAVYHSIADALADAGALAGAIPNGWVSVAAVALDQTGPEEPESGKGRRADISFAVHITNKLGAN